MNMIFLKNQLSIFCLGHFELKFDLSHIGLSKRNPLLAEWKEIIDDDDAKNAKKCQFRCGTSTPWLIVMKTSSC